MRAEGSKGFMFGFVLFVVTEASWLGFARLTGEGSRWVLESTLSILVALLVHFCGAAAFSAFAVPRTRGFIAFSGGVATAVVVALFAVGPGNLWPFVLVIDAAMLAPPLAAGFLVGVLLRRRAHHAA